MPTVDTALDRPSRPRRRTILGLGAGLGLAMALTITLVTVLGAGSGPGATAPPPPVPFIEGAGASADAVSAGSGAGAAAIGTAAYEPAPGALYVAPQGDNDAAGTADAPLRTIRAAIDRAEPGGTIVLREGQYHETFTIPDGKALTVQSYPQEEVWLDGSRAVDGWTADGGRWTAPWDVVLDASPTYTRGAPDNTREHWNFVTEAHPMAAHPDQLWWDGSPLEQVSGLDELTPTAFFHDEEAGLLHLGADPAGVEIRASDLQRAISVRAGGTVIRGIGIRRYAPSVPDFGAVTVERPGVLLENVIISESATTGLFITASDVTLRQVTTTSNGMIGVAANYADGLVVEGLDASGNNTERFNRAPVAGGMKLTRSRTVDISGSRFSDNEATGLWFDQSSRDIAITSTRFVGNRGHGVFLEISARAVIADNYIADNGRLGMKINGTSSVEIRNNVVVSTTSAISVLQDDRVKSDPSVPGHDERHMDDPEMTWLGTDVRIVGNTLVGSGDRALIWVEDYSGTYSAEDFGIVLEDNVFARADDGSPRTVVAWPMDPGDVTRFDSLDALTRAAGQERSGVEIREGIPLDRDEGASARRPALLPWIASTFGDAPHVLAALD